MKHVTSHLTTLLCEWSNQTLGNNDKSVLQDGQTSNVSDLAWHISVRLGIGLQE